jgi:hypothetical protein
MSITKRQSPRLNTSATALRQLEKHGLRPRKMTMHPDGSVEFDLRPPEEIDQDTDKQPNEWDRALGR